MSYSTISKDAVDRIWAYFINGGVDNALNLIKYAGYLLGQEASWKEPAPLLKAGLYWPLLQYPRLEELKKYWVHGNKIALITFYRALVTSGNFWNKALTLFQFMSLA